jgi:hypothetical protein
MFRNGSTLALAVALIVGGIAAYVVRVVLSPAAASPGTIVVAVAPLGFGMPLTVDNVIEIPWDSTTLPDGAFATKKALLKDGRRDVLRPIGRSEPVLSAKITAPGQPGTLAALLNEGKRAVTVRVDDVRGVAGFVSPGDRVDVVLIRSDTRNESYSDIILQRADGVGCGSGRRRTRGPPDHRQGGDAGSDAGGGAEDFARRQCRENLTDPARNGRGDLIDSWPRHRAGFGA